MKWECKECDEPCWVEAEGADRHPTRCPWGEGDANWQPVPDHITDASKKVSDQFRDATEKVEWVRLATPQEFPKMDLLTKLNNAAIEQLRQRVEALERGQG